MSVQHVTIQVILNDFLDPLQYCATLDKWSRSLAASPLEYCNYKFFFSQGKGPSRLLLRTDLHLHGPELRIALVLDA